MNIENLKTLVVAEYDSRALKSNVRYRALDKIVAFVKSHYGVDVAELPSDKAVLKLAYKEYKGSELSGAESSAVNEIYNQLICSTSC